MPILTDTGAFPQLPVEKKDGQQFAGDETPSLDSISVTYHSLGTSGRDASDSKTPYLCSLGSTVSANEPLLGSHQEVSNRWQSQRCSLETQCQPFEHWPIQFKFSVDWSRVSLPRSTTSSEWKCVLFVKFKSQHKGLSVFQYWKNILFLTTGYTGANKNTECLL